MATLKEKAIVGHMYTLAMEMAASDHTACIDYHGFVHGVDVRIAKKNSNDWEYYSETAYLSGRSHVWTEKTSLPLLNEMLHQLKKYHPAFDDDGIKLSDVLAGEHIQVEELV